jgi:hypothetical protein
MNTKTRAYKYKVARKEGAPFSLVSKLINLRSELVHIEKQFSDVYYNVSWSITLADGANGARFKMIKYSHPHWWSTRIVNNLSTIEHKERAMFKKALSLADVTMADFHTWIAKGAPGILQGPNHVKYDWAGCSFSFIITQLRIWAPHYVKMWCSEGVKTVIAAGHKWYANWGKRADEATPDDVDREVAMLFHQNLGERQ